MKKHFKHMTAIETNFLSKIVASSMSWKFSSHALDRMLEKNVSPFDIATSFKTFSIIEFHTESAEPRILIRGNSMIKGKHCCIVFAPKRNTVVTTYFNSANDNHKTINWNAYDKNINVIRDYQTN